MLDALKKDNRAKMEQVLKDLARACSTIRTGRASVSLVDHVMVEAYGSTMPLVQMATIATPDARTLVIQPFDPSQIKVIEKGIMVANLGLNPNNDGKVIRLTIPTLTEDRRKDFVKQAHKYAEDHRVAVRKYRHTFIEAVKKLEKDGKVAEDEMKRAIDEEQKVTDEFMAKIDSETKKKEGEIMEV